MFLWPGNTRAVVLVIIDVTIWTDLWILWEIYYISCWIKLESLAPPNATDNKTSCFTCSVNFVFFQCSYSSSFHCHTVLPLFFPSCYPLLPGRMRCLLIPMHWMWMWNTKRDYAFINGHTVICVSHREPFWNHCHKWRPVSVAHTAAAGFTWNHR